MPDDNAEVREHYQRARKEQDSDEMSLALSHYHFSYLEDVAGTW